MEKLEQIVKSKTLARVLLGLGLLIVALVIFRAGEAVGIRRGFFGCSFEGNYERVFGRGQRLPGRGEWGGVMGMMNTFRGEFTNSHGTIGSVIKINLPTIVIADKDGTEKIVTIKDRTIVRYGRDNVGPSDIKMGDSVVIMGVPGDDASINATLIRIMPSVGQDIPVQASSSATVVPVTNK
ncbi:MAG: hypothetical protein WC797_03445 [Candidatus Paceibacterota bacterium]|jgi:hypothetical protein